MNDTPLISVIVPIYNAETCLKRCVDSILSQTYDRLEVLLINDGSTDESGAIVAYYQKKYDRVIGITINNSGVANARNIGLSKATGDYVVFVDADDYLAPEFMRLMLDTSINTNTKLVTCHAINLYPNGSFFSAQDVCEGVRVIDYNDYSFLGKYSHHVAWGALYRKDLLEGMQFLPEYSVGEDTIFFATALKKANCVADLGKCLYYYTVQDQSLSRGRYGKKQFCEMQAWDKIVNDYSDQSLKARIDCHASRAIRALKGINLFTRYHEEDESLKRELQKYAKHDLPEVVLSSLKRKDKLLLIWFALFPTSYISFYSFVKQRTR